MTRALSLNPARALVHKAGRPDVRQYVTIEELRAARELARPRVREFLGLLWTTGARVSEALAVRSCDLDTHLQTVNLVTLKQRKKAGRAVPIPGEYFAELLVIVVNMSVVKGQHDRLDRLFSWSRSRAFELVRNALMAAGVERRRAKPMAIRHGHAIHALQGGAPLNVLQRNFGHSSIVTTSIYLQVTASDVREAYKRIEW